MFDHLVEQGAGMQCQLFIRGKKLAAFLLQQAFGGQPAASFQCQAFADIAFHCRPGKIYSVLPWIR
ncbi:MAG: hypothetical protein ACRCS3_06375, partial [Paracoccaceae bacterium]